jgi:hypothetical protein
MSNIVVRKTSGGLGLPGIIFIGALAIMVAIQWENPPTFEVIVPTNTIEANLRYDLKPDQEFGEVTNVSETLAAEPMDLASKLEMTPYQAIMARLQAEESFRPWYYPDGEYRSIAFGYNLIHGHKHIDAVVGKKIPRKGNQPAQVISYDEGVKLLQAHVAKLDVVVGEKFPDVKGWQKAALICKLYNRGQNSVDNPKKDIGHCCGHSRGHYGCGSSNPDIRKAHLVRRKRDYYMFHNPHKVDWSNVITKKQDVRKRWRNS